MRLAAAFAIALVLMLPASSSSLPPGPATIHASLRLQHIEYHDGYTIRAYRVFNRPAYVDPIGSALLLCYGLSGQRVCSEYLVLQRGQIIATGIVGSLAFYRLAVLGGTGYYDNVGGSIVSASLNPDVQQLIVNLQGA